MYNILIVRAFISNNTLFKTKTIYYICNTITDLPYWIFVFYALLSYNLQI